MKLSHKNLINIAKKNKIKINLKNKNIYLKLFKFISFLKIIEEELECNYHPDDQMKCPVHFCHGQESVPAALNQLLNKQDYLFSHHRSHGYYLSKKCPPKKLFAELYGKDGGANFGFAGSQDISFSKHNFYSGAIIAGSASIAVGAALSIKLNQKKNISVCGFGEAATDQGIFWEGLNYSALSNLPILFICENNNFSVFSKQEDRQAGNSISSKANSFGVKSLQVFGNDPVKVYNEIKNAIKYVKKKQKPFLIESFTYRTISHVGPLSDDPSRIDKTSDFKFWKKNSPYENLKKALIKKKYLTKKNLLEIENKIYKKIKTYFNFAKKNKFPKIKSFSKFNLSLKDSFQQKKIKIIKKNKVSYDQKIFQIKGY